MAATRGDVAQNNRDGFGVAVTEEKGWPLQCRNGPAPLSASALARALGRRVAPDRRSPENEAGGTALATAREPALKNQSDQIALATESMCHPKMVMSPTLVFGRSGSRESTQHENFVAVSSFWLL